MRKTTTKPSRPGAPARRWPAALVLLVVLNACSVFYRDPVVSLTDLQIVGLGLLSGTAEVTLEVENPNLFSFEVREFRYLLEVEDRDDRWARLAEGVSADTVRLPRRSTEEVTLRIPFSYGAVGTALRNLFSTGEIHYRLEGELKGRGPTGEMDLPVRAVGRMVP
jgi:LEA14-like dessication related protein